METKLKRRSFLQIFGSLFAVPFIPKSFGNDLPLKGMGLKEVLRKYKGRGLKIDLLKRRGKYYWVGFQDVEKRWWRKAGQREVFKIRAVATKEGERGVMVWDSKRGRYKDDSLAASRRKPFTVDNALAEVAWVENEVLAGRAHPTWQT